jgi:hypothetical protein
MMDSLILKNKLLFEKIRVAGNGYRVTGKSIADATASINRTNNSMGIILGDIFKQLIK